MIDILKRPEVRVSIFAAIVNAALLFLIIPEISSHLHPLYNQDVYADGYDYLAHNLAAGDGYRFYPDTARTTMREPGYPLLLAGLLIAFGNSFTAVKVTNLCLALSTAWLMTRIARRASSSPILIFVPPLLFLFHPATVVAESRGGVELLFTFLLVLFTVVLYWAMVGNLWWIYGLSGSVLGLAVLVKSTPILFPLFLLVYLIVVERKGTLATFGRVALMLVAMFVVLSPWIARNYSLTGKFIPTASVLGVSMQAGQYICEHRSSGEPMWRLDREASYERDNLARSLGYSFKQSDFYYQTFYSPADEVSFSSALSRQVVDVYRNDPLLCLKCVSSNMIYFWSAGKTGQSTVANMIVQLPYLILGIAGIVVSVRKRHFKLVVIPVLFIFYFLCVHAPILAQARYSMPLLPFISILAGIALESARRDRASLAPLQPVTVTLPGTREGVCDSQLVPHE
jgi:4-amino-4-deoxy-L-arabinose transferase-like glycosyltransferase